MSALGDAIREAREKKRLSQEQLGEFFGVTKSAVSAWESGKAIPDPRKFSKLIEVLDLKGGDVDMAYISSVITDTAAATDKDVQTRILAGYAAAQKGILAGDGPYPPQTLRRLADIPLWASSEAGEEGVVVLAPDPIDFLRRSERMENVKKPFAFYVVGETMSPVIEHGTQVIINPTLPPTANKDHVFIQDLPDGTMKATVKRLLKLEPTTWRVRQYSPMKDLDLPRAVWAKAFRITEKRED